MGRGVWSLSRHCAEDPTSSQLQSASMGTSRLLGLERKWSLLFRQRTVHRKPAAALASCIIHLGGGCRPEKKHLGGDAKGATHQHHCRKSFDTAGRIYRRL